VQVKKRASSAERGYGPKWQAERKKWLKAHPVCVLCKKPVKLQAVRGDPLLGVVNHKIPHRGDLKLFWSRSNWETQHKGCHDSVQQSFERTGVMRGCDEDGVPLDAGHHWRS
jgi:5-methylcytosine-specific restriction protein A